MDNKAWPWRKKSSEKIVVGADSGNTSSRFTDEEVQSLLIDKAELEKELKSLNDKLSYALTERDAKDDLVKKHVKTAQEALSGWERAEADAISLKQELDVALQQRLAGEERLMHMDAALKECMQQLRFVREEQEKRIHDAVMKTSREFEKTQTVLEEKLAETSKRLTKLGVENTHLSKDLLLKEKSIEELNEQKTRVEADFNALMTRLNSTEKDNSSLKYEVRVLEKELEIRNEEREFNRRTADASHRQHLESVKKIAKLELECQRLRLLVRKRLPGPAAMAKMKNEVEMLGRDSAEWRKKTLNTNTAGLMVDCILDNSPATPNNRISFLTEKLAMDEEKKTLKENLDKIINELQFSRNMHARTASKLSQVDSGFEESSGGQTTIYPTRTSLASQELSRISMSDIDSDDKVSCADSWASALISELEHFKDGKQKTTPSGKIVGVSDITLMDDFVEMEKLAIASADKALGANARSRPSETESSASFSEAISKETIPLSDSQSDISISHQETQSKDEVNYKVPGWLQGIMKVMLEQIRVVQRKPDEILGDIRVAMAYICNSNPIGFTDLRGSSNCYDASNPSHVWTNKSPVPDLFDRVAGNDSPTLEKSGGSKFHGHLCQSLRKIMELIEGISLPSLDQDSSETFSGKDGNPFTYKNSETPMGGYMVRVFQWKTSELSCVLQRFVDSCNDFLDGKADLEKFAFELASALDWIMNHCFSLQDVSSMRHAIKTQFGWDDTRSESEAEIGTMGQISEADKLHVQNIQYPSFASNSLYVSQTEELQSNVKEETRRLKEELLTKEYASKNMEGMLHSAIDQSDSLRNQLQESDKTIASLRTELELSKQSVLGDQMENYRLMNEDLNMQLTVARVELIETRQHFASLEVELENRINRCEELEAACLELQLQLESVKKKENSSPDIEQEEKQLRTDWEIAAASEKLAECQETILNLGKQLKALASPREAALFDKVISSPTDATTTQTIINTDAATTNTAGTPKKNMNQFRSSLLDRMLADDDAEANDLKSPKTKEMVSSSNLQKPPTLLDGNYDSSLGTAPPENFVGLNGIKHHENEAAVGSLAMVPAKKRGSGGLWRKLLWRRKKGGSKETAIPFAADA